MPLNGNERSVSGCAQGRVCDPAVRVHREQAGSPVHRQSRVKDALAALLGVGHLARPPTDDALLDRPRAGTNPSKSLREVGAEEALGSSSVDGAFFLLAGIFQSGSFPS